MLELIFLNLGSPETKKCKTGLTPLGVELLIVVVVDVVVVVVVVVTSESSPYPIAKKNFTIIL